MSAGGFKVWHSSEYLVHNPHVAAAAIASVLVISASVAYRVMSPKVAVENAPDEAFVPPSNLGLRNIFDLIVSLVQGLAKDIIGDHYAKYLPSLSFLFLWIWFSNLLGAIPGLGASTDNLNMTLAMAACVFLYYNVQGFFSHGLHYIESYTGHLKGVLLYTMGIAIMFPIEVISHCVRPLTLGIRLRSNMYADHSVFGVISGMFSHIQHSLAESMGTAGAVIGGVLASLGPVPIVILGLLVATIQAFVFTLLTMVYIGMATAHEEH